MKIFFTLFAFAFILIFSACEPEEVPAPVNYPTVVSVKPIYSKYSNDGYKKFLLSEPLRIYAGDTVRYEINYQSSTKISSLEVYYKINNGTAEVPVSSETFLNKTEVTTKFEHIVWAAPGSDLTFYIRMRDEKNQEIIPVTGVMPKVEIKVEEPLVYINKRLYNSHGSQANSFEIPNNLNNLTFNQELKENPWPSLYALLQNIEDMQTTDKNFVPNFRAGDAMTQVGFVKVPAQAYTMWEEPNKIKLGLQQYGPSKAEMKNVQVGDVYAFKAKYSRSDSWVIYGVMKVTAIQNDNLTSSQGGTDNDYLQFDIKYFPGYRF